jgi:hypothetical protein
MSEQKIANTFEKMRDTIDQYTKVVRQDGALWKSIEEIGGDPAWLNDIKTALDTVYTAIEEADMGARMHLDMQDESADLSEEPNEGNEFSGALAQAKQTGKKEFEVDGKKYKVQEGQPYDDEEENPTKDAIIHRLSISGRLSDLLKQHGLDRVEAAIDDVAEFHSDAEELGSSDISIMVKQVMNNLESTNESLGYLKKLAGI